jgi:para-aminobenzoate synthetase component 1
LTSPLLQHQLPEVLHDELPEWKHRLLHWAAQFPYALFLDSCQSEQDRYGKYEFLLGVGKKEAAVTDWASWQEAVSSGKWVLGGLPYELKNRFEPSVSQEAQAGISFPEVACFVPETVIYLPKGRQQLQVEGPAPDWDELLASPPSAKRPLSAPDFRSNFSRETYLKCVQKLRDHIAEGDFYEINLSQVFTADYCLSQPAQLFEQLVEVSPVPFAAFFRFGEKYLLCASPERFLQSRGDRLLTQPIKGTAPRGQNPQEDEELKQQLQHSLKERAENVMIVDLSRNDLYRSCEVNSVSVPHLFEIQSFPQVHQMVSSIIGTRQEGLSSGQVLSHTFPPGSMTGAPKVMSMNMIDRYEGIARGLYAGSVGYFAPDGDFDLNVVIRSLIYDHEAHKLAYQVGGAITYDSDPEAEYQETLVKARAIRSLFR